MGGNARDRSVRSDCKARHTAKHQPSSSFSSNPPTTALPPASFSSSSSSFPYPSPSTALEEGYSATDQPTPNPNPNPSDAYDDNGWRYCTEEQLEELLLKNLDFVYREARNRLATTGYDGETTLWAVLCSGHCYGSMDALSNIIQYAMAHLNSPATAGDCDAGSSVPASGFTDLRHLQEYSLAGMVCLLQQIRDHLSRGDAMWCLLMSDLHVGRASAIDIPPCPPPPPPTLPPPSPPPPTPPPAAALLMAPTVRPRRPASASSMLRRAAAESLIFRRP